MMEISHIVTKDNVGRWAAEASLSDFEVVLSGIAAELQQRNCVLAVTALDEALLRLGRIRRAEGKPGDYGEQGGAWAEFLTLLAMLAGITAWGIMAFIIGRF